MIIIKVLFEREWEIHLTNMALDNIEPLFSGKAVDAFRLTLQGKSVEEIANELELKENSVYRLKNRVKEQMEQTQKNYYLNEQMRAIKKEMGAEDDGGDEIRELAESGKGPRVLQ